MCVKLWGEEYLGVYNTIIEVFDVIQIILGFYQANFGGKRIYRIFCLIAKQIL